MDRWRHSWIKLISKDLMCDLATLASLVAGDEDIRCAVLRGLC